MLVEIVVFAAVLFLLLQSFRKPPGLPPGRWGLPLVGYIPLTRKTVKEQIGDLHKQYGDIYLWRMGTQVMVFVHNPQLVREAFTRPEFPDRPEWETFKLLEDPALGVGSANGAIWHNNRRFTSRQLRDMGMGKSSLVSSVHKQATQLVESLTKQVGTPAPLPHALKVAVVNVIWQMIGSRQFDETDPRLKEFEDLLSAFMLSTGRITIKDFLPWLDYVLPAFVIDRVFRISLIRQMMDKLYGYFDEVVEEHRNTLDPENPRDLIDSYLVEMEEKKDDPKSTCSDRDLSFLVLDLFFSGSDTTANTMTWLVNYLADRPGIQSTMQAEIDRVLPNGTLATLEDKPRMPYTEGVINEALRLSSLAAYGVQHVANQDTELGGYVIPKGAIINSVSFSIHRDPRFWDQPDKFLPERWLGPDGKITTKKDAFMPFGTGKRSCVGENMARMELFILTTTLFQNFDISNPTGKLMDLTPEPGVPFFNVPRSQDVLITARR